MILFNQFVKQSVFSGGSRANQVGDWLPETSRDNTEILRQATQSLTERRQKNHFSINHRPSLQRPGHHLQLDQGNSQRAKHAREKLASGLLCCRRAKHTHVKSSVLYQPSQQLRHNSDNLGQVEHIQSPFPAFPSQCQQVLWPYSTPGPHAGTVDPH